MILKGRSLVLNLVIVIKQLVCVVRSNRVKYIQPPGYFDGYKLHKGRNYSGTLNFKMIFIVLFQMYSNMGTGGQGCSLL